VQSTFLTGLLPREHGIVGNGWYFRDLGEVFLWRQHNALVHGEKVWDAARRARPGYRVANVCWWYAMGATTDFTVTPRPIYHADGHSAQARTVVEFPAYGGGLPQVRAALGSSGFDAAIRRIIAAFSAGETTSIRPIVSWARRGPSSFPASMSLMTLRLPLPCSV